MFIDRGGDGSNHRFRHKLSPHPYEQVRADTPVAASHDLQILHLMTFTKADWKKTCRCHTDLIPAKLPLHLQLLQWLHADSDILLVFSVKNESHSNSQWRRGIQYSSKLQTLCGEAQFVVAAMQQQRSMCEHTYDSLKAVKSPCGQLLWGLKLSTLKISFHSSSEC